MTTTPSWESWDFLLKWCWNSDVADVCVDYCEGKWWIAECLHFSCLCAARSKPILMRLELWFVIYWLDPCEKLSGGCLSDVTVFLAVTVTVAELHSKTKNCGASWENDESSLTYKPQRRGVQEPRYKSIETGESDHTLFVRALLLSFPCRPSPVRWGCGKEEKQTLITIRAPRPSWGHTEWMSLAPGEGIRMSPSSLIKQCEESNAC